MEIKKHLCSLWQLQNSFMGSCKYAGLENLRGKKVFAGKPSLQVCAISYVCVGPRLVCCYRRLIWAAAAALSLQGTARDCNILPCTATYCMELHVIAWN